MFQSCGGGLVYLIHHSINLLSLLSMYGYSQRWPETLDEVYKTDIRQPEYPNSAVQSRR